MQVRSTAGTLVRDVLLDVVRFPLWWYTVGVTRAVRFAGGEITSWGRRLSLVILFRNLLKPMYGDYSRSGRLISLFFRLVTFVIKLGVMIVWTAIVVAAVAVWVLLPGIAVVLFVRALGG